MSTVSKVLNGRSGVSDPVRARVERLLHSSGYSRRGLEFSHSNLIELVFENVDSEWSLQLIRGVNRIARENGMSVVLTESGNRHSPSPEWIDGAVKRRPVGVILIFSDLSDDHKQRLRTRNIPFVVVDPAGDPAPDVASIGSANWAGGLMATRHLLELGHRRIGVITGAEDMMSARARVSGYRAALEEAGIAVEPELILPGRFRYEDGVESGTRLLTSAHPPTAIVTGNDQQAFGVYEAARSLGLIVPTDVSVVGYDDIPSSRWMAPQLTTIRQPLTEMAEQATRLVLALRDNPTRSAVRLDLATSLVVRGSTAPPAAEKMTENR
jgi:LacI family transcriptional regulator, xylobiose transport system transcriptional regulator